MIDREKVIKGLECCFDVQSEWKDKIWACPTCPYAKDDGEPCETLAPLLDEALTLLKAQESPKNASMSSAIECLLHPQDADDSDMTKAIDIAVRAMRSLRDREPRVMTLEELADWHKKPESERDPIYVEYLPNSGLGTSKWTIEYFGFNPNLYPNKNSGYYGKWLRCWTSRPTLEQREATPWQ